MQWWWRHRAIGVHRPVIDPTDPFAESGPGSRPDVVDMLADGDGYSGVGLAPGRPLPVLDLAVGELSVDGAPRFAVGRRGAELRNRRRDPDVDHQ